MAGSMEGMAPGAHRFYENEFPQIEELVLARITRIESMGAYAELLEYGNREGMLLLSELSKRRFRSVNKLIKVGRVEYVMVIRVDQDKGYIDLSKKRVESSEIPLAEERYSKSKKVHLTVRTAAEAHPELGVEGIYREIVWPLYKTHPHALDGLLLCLEDREAAFKHVNREKISEAVIDTIVDDLKSRMTPPSSRMRATFDVSCTGYSGVLAVKEAIGAGVEEANKLIPENDPEFKNDLSVRLIAPPRFICTLSDYDKERGVQRLKVLMETAGDRIRKEEGGACRVFEDVTIYGDDDEENMVGAEEDESDDSYDDSSSEEIEGMGEALGEVVE